MSKQVLSTAPDVLTQTIKETSPVRTFTIKPKNVAVVLGCAIVVLLAAHLTAIFFWDESEKGVHFASALNKHFNFNNERNIPTFFSSLLLLFSALLCFLIYSTQKMEQFKNIHLWRVLGIIFVFMSVDEVMQLHERINNSFQNLFPASQTDYVFWPWMILYSGLVFITGAYFFKFLFRLPPKTRNLFILSGTIYVSGALGIEYFEGRFDQLYGLNNVYTRRLVTVEEVCEMTGVSIFIYASLQFLAPLKVKLNLEQEST